MALRTTTPIGRAVLEAREGKRNKAYRDSKGVWTIGIGHTAAAGAPVPFAGLIISDVELDELFACDLAKYEATVNASLKVEVADHEFDALVSICYNIGQAGESHSTFLRLLNAGDREGATKHILDWEKDKILIPRREAEAAQFHIPYSTMLPSRVAGEAPIKGPAPIPTVANAPVLNSIIRKINAAAAPQPAQPVSVVLATPVAPPHLLPPVKSTGLMDRFRAAFNHKVM